MNKYTNTQNIRRSVKLSALALAIGSALFCLMAVGCSNSPEASEVAAKYTEQTARAIIEGSWKIASAIVFAAVIRGLMNK